MSDFIEFCKIVLLPFAAVCIVVFLTFQFYGQYQCNNFKEITGKETKWIAFDSCYVKTEYGWQRWDEYKQRAIASEAAKELRK